MIDVKLLGLGKHSGQKGVFEGVLTYVAMTLISIVQIEDDYDNFSQRL